MTFMKTVGTAAAAALMMTAAASAETRITYKSAKAGSSYFQMAVQIAEAMKAGTDGDIAVTVEESQGSVQNVMEVRARGADYVFTTPPCIWLGWRRGGKAMFEGKGDPSFDDIRALFPDPFPDDAFRDVRGSGATSFADMEGKTILAGQAALSGPPRGRSIWVCSA